MDILCLFPNSVDWRENKIIELTYTLIATYRYLLIFLFIDERREVKNEIYTIHV